MGTELSYPANIRYCLVVHEALWYEASRDGGTFRTLMGALSSAERGRVINAVFDAIEDTLLFRACFWNCIENVRVLLSYPELDVNRPASNGRTPLKIACDCGHVDIVRELCEVGHADPNIPDVLGVTPLIAVAEDPRQGETIRYLLAFHQVGAIDIHAKKIQSSPRGVREVTALMRTREVNAPSETLSLLESYERAPRETRATLRRSMGFGARDAAHDCAAIVLVSDDYLSVKPQNLCNCDCDGLGRGRFYLLCARLPLELQMLVSRKRHGLAGDIVSGHLLELAFRDITCDPQ